MPGKSQADFVGQQQDGVNKNTSSVMIPQVVSSQPVALEDIQKQIKEIVCKLVIYILELSIEQPNPVDQNILALIEELVDAKVEPEQFCDRLEELLSIYPQPCISQFLTNCLPLLRQSLMLKEIVIDGIRPPRH